MGHLYRNHGCLLSAVLVAGLALAPAAVAQECDACGKGHCPPFYKYHYEGPPKIKFKCGCPRPVCDHCNLPHYGYYQTCWHPWPFPPDWSHCPVPPPGVLAPQDIPPPGTRRVLTEPPPADREKTEPPKQVEQPSSDVVPPSEPVRAIPVSSEK